MNIEPENAHVSVDPSSFVSTAVAQHRAALLRYATRILHGDAGRAEDVVQDTFVRLMAQSPEDVEDHVAEWLFTVCRNRATDLLRKEGRMSYFVEGQAERLVAAEARPGAGLEKSEQQAAVLQLINKLPRNQQEVVRLKFQNGFSYQEISRITSLSVSNVGFILHTAIKNLRQHLAAQPE